MRQDTSSLDVIWFSDSKRPNGVQCTDKGQCSSGNCVTNVCCDQPCKTTCMTCVHVKKGTCSPTPAGTDPDYHCTAKPVEKCEEDGMCDGKGGCRLYPVGTPCLAAKCTSNEKLDAAKTCDITGKCTGAKDVQCFPYQCDFLSSACFYSCTTANESTRCQPYYACNGVTGQCFSSCSKNKECTNAGKCMNMKCVKK